MKNEKDRLLSEWLDYALSDLDSAKILLEQSKNYNISVYHSQQAIEKILKWFLIKNNKEFPFVHDLKKLLDIINTIKDYSDLYEYIKDINEIFPSLRYPTGDKVTKKAALNFHKIANKVIDIFSAE